MADAENRVREELAALRAEISTRDEAFQEFQRRLSEEGAGRPLVEVSSIRKWYADERVAGRDQAELNEELTRRLTQAWAVADAREAFDRDVAGTDRWRLWGQGDAAFRDSTRAAELRERFVNELADSSLGDEQRAQLVHEQREEYKRAEREWRQQNAANRAFEAALRVDEPAGPRRPGPEPARVGQR